MLPFCQHKEGKKYVTEDLGEVLEGDRLVNTPYEIKFKQDVDSHVLCSKKLTGNDLYNVRMAISEDYYFQVLIVIDSSRQKGAAAAAGGCWFRGDAKVQHASGQAPAVAGWLCPARPTRTAA